jgi:hypothetical protein
MVRHREIPPDSNLMKIVEVLIYELENQNVLQSSDVETRIIEQGNPKTTKEQFAEKFGLQKSEPDKQS